MAEWAVVVVEEPLSPPRALEKEVQQRDNDVAVPTKSNTFADPSFLVWQNYPMARSRRFIRHAPVRSIRNGFPYLFW
jgi:hypothetical protein